MANTDKESLLLWMSPQQKRQLEDLAWYNRASMTAYLCALIEREFFETFAKDVNSPASKLLASRAPRKG